MEGIYKYPQLNFNVFDLEKHRFWRLIMMPSPFTWLHGRGLCKTVITPTVGLTIVITKAPRGRITGTGRWGFKWGANWDDSPDIMDTWVPFPNVSLPATPPDSHCRWHHYRNSLALSIISVEEALVSHKDWRITLCRVRPSALLCWDFVLWCVQSFPPAPSCRHALG